MLVEEVVSSVRIRERIAPHDIAWRVFACLRERVGKAHPLPLGRYWQLRELNFCEALNSFDRRGSGFRPPGTIRIWSLVVRNDLTQEGLHDGVGKEQLLQRCRRQAGERALPKDDRGDPETESNYNQKICRFYFH